MSVMQNNYLLHPAAGQPGHVAAAEQVTNIVSRVVKGKTAISPGSPVRQGAQDFTVTAFQEGTGTFLGIALQDPAHTTPNFLPSTTLAVLTRGVVFVRLSAAVKAGDKVYATPSGLYTNIEKDNERIGEALFDTSGSAEGLAIVRLH